MYSALKILWFLVIGLFLPWAWLRWIQVNRREILRRVLARVHGELTTSTFKDTVEGRHLDRRFRLEVGTPWFAGFREEARYYPLTASQELLHAPPIHLRIRRDQGLAAVEKALGLVRDVEVAAGDDFDGRYLVEVEAEADHAPLADRDVRRCVDTLLSYWDLEEVAIQDGWLVVRGRTHHLGKRLIHDLLDALEVLARAYDRRPALEIGLQERFAWVGGVDQAPRCPYCHEALGDPDLLVACAECSTLLHDECFTENGGCPILGCGGRGSEPTGPIPLKE